MTRVSRKTKDGNRVHAPLAGKNLNLIVTLNQYPQFTLIPSPYRREIAVPEDWQGWRVWLRFEGVCNWGDVYLDGVKVGRVDSFVAPYEFDVTELAVAKLKPAW
jgi:beta-galactosidase/beta-glucuronidase